jgi:hypothetical protein
METIKARPFRKFMTVYSILKNKRLRADIRLSLHKALPICGRHPNYGIVKPAKRSPSDDHILSKEHTNVQFMCAFNIRYVYDFMAKLCIASRRHTNHENEKVRDTGQDTADHRIYSDY